MTIDAGSYYTLNSKIFGYTLYIFLSSKVILSPDIANDWITIDVYPDDDFSSWTKIC